MVFSVSVSIVSHNDSADEHEATSVFTIAPFQASAIHQFCSDVHTPVSDGHESSILDC